MASLESTITIKVEPSLVSVLERIANALESGGEPSGKSKGQTSKTKDKPAHEKPVEEKEYTKDDVRAILSKVHESALCKEKGTTPPDCLSRGGVTQLGKLEPENYAKVIRSAEKALKTGEA